MGQYKATVTWVRETPDFKMETYDRTHTIKYPGGITVKASSAPEYAGKPQFVNPEEALAGALSSCHMLTFLAVAAKSGFTVDRYEDEAVATLDKNANGKLAVTRILLHPKVAFSGTAPDPSKLQALHEKAHANCFIANSLKCEMAIEPRN